MTKTRSVITKSVKDEVLKEYSYMCAVCGNSNLQLHHIDNDPSNNEPLSLIPLCPNHHLIDQHNPTKKIDTRILKLFGEYKDPTILSPQFFAIYERIRFLEQIDSSEFRSLLSKSQGLIRFIKCIEMCEYYADRLEELTTPPKIYFTFVPIRDNPKESELQDREKAAAELVQYNDFKAQLSNNSIEIIKLVVESLRFQKWWKTDIVATNLT